MTEAGPVNAFVAVTRNQTPIPSTIRPTPDEAWQALRDQVTEPDTLAERGWHVRRATVTVGERVK